MDKGKHFPVRAGIFIRHRIQTDSGAHPAPYPTGTGDPFSGSKAAGAWSYTHIPPYVFMVWYLLKHRKTLLHLLYGFTACCLHIGAMSTFHNCLTTASMTRHLTAERQNSPYGIFGGYRVMNQGGWSGQGMQHAWERWEIRTIFWLENLNGRNHSVDLAVAGWIILKWMLD